jgi:hypothetical protein
VLVLHLPVHRTQGAYEQVVRHWPQQPHSRRRTYFGQSTKRRSCSCCTRCSMRRACVSCQLLRRCCSGAEGTSRLSSGYSLHTRQRNQGGVKHNRRRDRAHRARKARPGSAGWHHANIRPAATMSGHVHQWNRHTTTAPCLASRHQTSCACCCKQVHSGIQHAVLRPLPAACCMLPSRT